MGPAPRSRVLLAVSPGGAVRLRRVLEGHDVALVRTRADDEAGNARIRRIIDYLILIDGDLQHIARAAGDTVVPPALERRSGGR